MASSSKSTAAEEVDYSCEDETALPVSTVHTEEEKPQPAAAAAATAETTTTKKKKKTTTMRRGATEQQVRCYLASHKIKCPERPPPLMESLSKDKEVLAMVPQDVLDACARVDAIMDRLEAIQPALDEELRKERQEIIDYYYPNGYDEEEEEAAMAAAPRPGRRRFRPGLVKRAGRTRKLI